MVTTREEAARIVAARTGSLNESSGVLLAQAPAAGLDIEPILAEAVDRVRATGVTGQAVTPAVLALVEELSGGPQRRGQPAAHRRQCRAGRRGGRRLRGSAGGHRRLTRDRANKNAPGDPGILLIADILVFGLAGLITMPFPRYRQPLGQRVNSE